MRKYWPNYCFIHFDLTKRQIRQIEKSHKILVIPNETEQIVDSIFLHNYQKLGFEKVLTSNEWIKETWDSIRMRIGKETDFKNVDYIVWKNGVPYTCELETWASFARFHKYIYDLDFIVCLQKDEWYGGYGENTQIIELRNVLGLREIILRSELESFLYENDREFREFYRKILSCRLMSKMLGKPEETCLKFKLLR